MSEDYRPLMSADRADRIRQWHEAGYRNLAARTESQVISYLGREFVVPPSVMPITPVSHLLGEAVLSEVREGDRVLDMGTGSGVNAILAAERAREVLAVDINPDALTATRDNAMRNGVEGRVVVHHSDVFENVDGKFDVIVFDPPFRWFTPRDLIEAAATDANYSALTRFFRDAKRHLIEDGRILMFFGDSGDLAYLRTLIDAHGFEPEIIATRAVVQNDWQVEYTTFRLTPRRDVPTQQPEPRQQAPAR